MYNGTILSWNLKKSPIINSQYHYNYGHCITIDISALSKDNGKIPMTDKSATSILNLKIKTKGGNAFMSLFSLLFIHNGTNIDKTITYWNSCHDLRM